jgi:hypothetical protein
MRVLRALLARKALAHANQFDVHLDRGRPRRQRAHSQATFDLRPRVSAGGRPESRGVPLLEYDESSHWRADVRISTRHNFDLPRVGVRAFPRSLDNCRCAPEESPLLINELICLSETECDWTDDFWLQRTAAFTTRQRRSWCSGLRELGRPTQVRGGIARELENPPELRG